MTPLVLTARTLPTRLTLVLTPIATVQQATLQVQAELAPASTVLQVLMALLVVA